MRHQMFISLSTPRVPFLLPNRPHLQDAVIKENSGDTCSLFSLHLPEPWCSHRCMTISSSEEWYIRLIDTVNYWSDFQWKFITPHEVRKLISVEFRYCKWGTDMSRNIWKSQSFPCSQHDRRVSLLWEVKVLIHMHRRLFDQITSGRNVGLLNLSYVEENDGTFFPILSNQNL